MEHGSAPAGHVKSRLGCDSDLVAVGLERLDGALGLVVLDLIGECGHALLACGVDGGLRGAVVLVELGDREQKDLVRRP